MRQMKEEKNAAYGGKIGQNEEQKHDQTWQICYSRRDSGGFKSYMASAGITFHLLFKKRRRQLRRFLLFEGKDVNISEQGTSCFSNFSLFFARLSIMRVLQVELWLHSKGILHYVTFRGCLLSLNVGGFGFELLLCRGVCQWLFPLLFLFF